MTSSTEDRGGEKYRGEIIKRDPQWYLIFCKVERKK